MIAIASGLLGNLETATAAVAKKDGGSSGFAAAFEEVSAKDAGVVAQARVNAQGRLVAGGGSGRGQTGIASGRSARSAVLAAKTAVAKAAGESVTAVSTSEGISGAVDAKGTDKATSSTAVDAAKPTLGAKLNVGDVVEVQNSVQEELAGGEARLVGPAADDEEVVGGKSSRLESTGWTLAGAPPEASAKVLLKGVGVSVPPAVPSTGVVQQVRPAPTTGIKTGGRVDAGSVPARTVDLGTAVESTSGKAAVVAASDAVATGVSSSVQYVLQDAGGGFRDGTGGDGTTALKDIEFAAPLATGLFRPVARVSNDAGTGAATKAQGPSGGSATSTAKPALQRAGGTVQVQPTDVPVSGEVLVNPVVPGTGQIVTGATVLQNANVTPAAEAKQASAQPITITAEGVDGDSKQVAGRGRAPVAEQVGSRETVSQQLTAQAVVAQPVTEQPTVVQPNVVQPLATVPQGAAGLVTQDSARVAQAFGGPAAGTEQATSQRAAQGYLGNQQAAARQVESTQAGAQQVQTPLVGAQPLVAAQVSSLEEGSAAQKQDHVAGGPADALQLGGEPISAEVAAGITAARADAENNKPLPGVTANISGTGKKVATTSSDRLNAGGLSAATSAPVPIAPVSPDPGTVAITQPTLVSGTAEKMNNTLEIAPGTKADISTVPVRGASASPMLAGTVAAQAGALAGVQDFTPGLETTSIAGQTIVAGSARSAVVGLVQDSPAPIAAAVLAEAAVPQAGRVAAGGAARERKLPTPGAKTPERASAETAPVAQPIALQHLAGPMPDATKAPGSSHQTPVESGTQSLTPGTAGLGGGGGVVPLSATQIVAHDIVAPAMIPVTAASGTVPNASLTNSMAGLTSPGAAGTDSLVSPMGHTTLQATPTVLEVGVPGGTHGWLKIRAEIGEGGTVQASMSAATHEGAETLRRELPAMNAFLDSEHVPVSVQIAAHGVSGVGTSSLAGASVTGGDAGLNLGSGLMQDAGSGRSEAQSGLLAGGDGARQGSGQGSQENGQAVGAPVSGRAAASAEADWVSSSTADPGSGYGTGISANGGSWLNVMA